MSLFTRKDWKARPPRSVTQLPWNKVDALVIHYSAAASDELPDYAARVRGIQNYHMDSNGWADIAYNWLVSRTGDAFQGRGYGVMSAATLNNNGHTQAICFLGADAKGRDDVTDRGRRAIANLLFTAEKLKGAKLGSANFQVKGHRDFVSTECPGDELYAFVKTRGWEAYRPSLSVYPPGFFKWAAWRLGEGAYAKYGPANPAVRPAVPKLPVTAVYWLALRRFLRARN